MTPEPREMIEQFLLMAERTIHRNGWDQAPFLGYLEWINRLKLGMGKIPMEILNPAGTYVEFVGTSFRDKPALPRGFVQDLVRGQFYGIFFACEAWHAERATQQDLIALHRSGKSLADVPGSTEARMLTLVDIWGRVHQVERIRGKKPTVWPAGAIPGGRMIEGLRQTTLAIVKQLPNMKDNVEALKALDILNLDAMNADGTIDVYNGTAAQKS